MIDVGSAVGYLLLDTSGFQSGFRSAMNDLKTFQSESATAADKFSALGSSLTSVGGTLTKSVTLPIAGLGATITAVTANFESSMSKVAAIAGLDTTGEEFDALSEKAKEMGAKTKFSASEAADAFTYMAMAGWKTEAMLDGIDGIMQLAAASGEDLALTSDIVTDALTAFGLQAKDSAHFSDVLAAASNNANTNVSMLGESFKYVAPVAGSLGYSVEDTSIALGLMANSGIKASQAGTALRTVLTNMAKPTDDMQYAMDALGVSLTDSEGNMNSLMDIMKQLRAGFKGGQITQEEYMATYQKLTEEWKSGTLDTKAYAQQLNQLRVQLDGTTEAEQAELAAMLAGKEGMSGLLAIVNSSDEDFQKLSDSIYAADGTAAKMAETMQDNLSGQITILKSALEGLAISFGEILIPYLTKAVQWLTQVIDKFNSMDEGTKKVIVVISTIAAAIGPVLLIVGKLASSISSIISLIGGTGGLGAIITALTGPLGIVLAAVTAFVAAWVTDFGGIREKTAAIFESIKTIFTTVWEFISTLWEDNFLNLRGIASNVWESIESIFSTAFGIISNLWQMFAAVFQGDWDTVWNLVKDSVSQIWETIKTLFVNFLNIILDTLSRIAIKLFQAAKSTFGKVKEGFQNVWESIKTWFSGAINDPVGTILGIGTALFEAGKSIFTSLWDGMKSVWESITSWVSSAVTWISDKVKSWVDTGSQVWTGGTRGGVSVQGSYAGGLDYVPSDRVVRVHEGEAILTKQENANRNNSGGDTYNFYSPVALTPTKAAQEFKRAKQELALGFT